MADKTGISWTDSTWNCVRGCSRVSEGCRNCYAERVAARFSDPGMPYHGLARRKLTIVNNEERDRGNRSEPRWTGEVRLIPEHLADPLRWRKPRRIFVNSMSDLFHEKLTNEEIAAVFGVMAAAPQHTFQVLTKRAKRMREWFEWVEVERAGAYLPNHETAVVVRHAEVHVGPLGADCVWPLPNVWIGVSVENQDAADDRIPELLATPAAVRFLSCEPLIGPVDLAAESPNARSLAEDLDWVIVGCESGPGARRCDVDWIRSLRDQCAASLVALFVKQANAATCTEWRLAPDGQRSLPVIEQGPGSKRKAGGVIELPYLDGVQHAAFPAVTA